MKKGYEGLLMTETKKVQVVLKLGMVTLPSIAQILIPKLKNKNRITERTLPFLKGGNATQDMLG